MWKFGYEIQTEIVSPASFSLLDPGSMENFMTVVFDLTVALQIGLVLACVLFVRRMSSLFQVTQTARDEGSASFQLCGSLFFGAVAKIDPVLTVVFFDVL